MCFCFEIISGLEQLSFFILSFCEALNFTSSQKRDVCSIHQMRGMSRRHVGDLKCPFNYFKATFLRLYFAFLTHLESTLIREPWSGGHLQTISQLIKKIPAFMKPRVSLLCSYSTLNMEATASSTTFVTTCQTAVHYKTNISPYKT